MTIPPLVVRVLAGCAVFLGTWSAGRAAVALTVREPGPPPPMSAEEKALRATGVPLRAALGPEVRELLGGEAGALSLVLVLRDRDLRTCEDVGRQLRELRRTAPLPAVVLTDSTSEPRVRAFLRREKLRLPVHVLATVDRVLLRPEPLPSPAALRVVDGEADGIAYPNRTPGVRTRSFAQALADVAAPPRSSAPAGWTITRSEGTP